MAHGTIRSVYLNREANGASRFLACSSIVGSLSISSTLQCTSRCNTASVNAPVPAPRSSTRSGRASATALAACTSISSYAGMKSADALIVGVDIDAQVAAYGMAHG